jgi:hypothetical protein
VITTDELHALATVARKAAEHGLPVEHIQMSNYSDIGVPFLSVYVETVDEMGAWCEAWDVTPPVRVDTNPDGTVITSLAIPFGGVRIELRHHLKPVAVSA